MRSSAGRSSGQALKAAALTVASPTGRRIRLHGYFLLPGITNIPVIYDVELTRDGGSFSTRRVVARQRGKTIFHMELSFHREEHGFEHAATLDVDPPEPEKLLNSGELAEQYAAYASQGAAAMAMRSVDRRIEAGESGRCLPAESAGRTRGLYWMRSASALA